MEICKARLAENRLYGPCLLFKGNSKPIGELTHYLSVAACVKDEGRYLREWIEYHLWAGVDHFYIYDNGSTDNTWEVLAPYILRGTVTYRYWVGDRENGNQQVRMYNDAAVRYRLCTRWLAFIDADEYITLTPEGKRQFGVDEGGGLQTSLGNTKNTRALASTGFALTAAAARRCPKAATLSKTTPASIKTPTRP